jgi:glucosamine--fructose-6-phosphate aminotransferase (isomerizing)
MKPMLKDTFLYQEIHQEPQVHAGLIERELPNARALAAAARRKEPPFVVIAARGTSDNAARYANYLLGAMNGLPVSLATPSLYSIYKQPPRLDRALVLAISQSGKSPDIVAVLAEARRQGALTAAITNDPDSDIAHEADHVINLGAGPERSVAATKTYAASLTAIALMSACLAQDEAMLSALRLVPGAVERTLGLEPRVAEVVQRYRYMRDCVVFGRGYNYATAYEIALKLKELTYTMVEPYSSADFLHGPLAVLEHGFPAIVVSPAGAMVAEMKEFMGTIRQREAEILAISDDDATLELAHFPVRLPAPLPEWLSPITAVVPGQLLAMHLAFIRNYDPDHPRAIHKVTETI